MKKATLRRLYEDACNEMAAAEVERAAALAEQDALCEQVESGEELYSELLRRYDRLTLALAHLWGDDRKSEFIDMIADAGPESAARWAHASYEVASKRRAFPEDSSEPSDSVKAVRGSNGVTFQRGWSGWRALPPEGDGLSYSWWALNSSRSPEAVGNLADVTSEVT